jgi:branched-subunit amino acid ABC-type transport system permease component
MRKIIWFSLVFQCLFLLISLLLITIKEGYGTELFTYAFYTNLIYFLIGFIFNVILTKLLYKYKENFYLLFSFGVLIMFNIYIYVVSGSDKVFFSGGLFHINDDSWDITIFYHLSILLSTLIMMFPLRKVFNFKIIK